MNDSLQRMSDFDTCIELSHVISADEKNTEEHTLVEDIAREIETIFQRSADVYDSSMWASAQECISETEENMEAIRSYHQKQAQRHLLKAVEAKRQRQIRTSSLD